MEEFKTPISLFIETDKRFQPQKPENKYDLFWHTKQFLEDNKNNEKITKITATNGAETSNELRINRLNNIKNYLNTIYDEFDKKTQNLWKYEPKREEIISNAEQLLVRSQYNMGYAQSGLYLDYNKFFEVLDNKTKPMEAKRIIDNNLFLGNMATFYTSSVEEGEQKEVIENAKHNYLKTLELMQSDSIHFRLPYEEPKYFKFLVQDGDVKLKVFSKEVQDNGVYVASGPQVLSEFIFFKSREKEEIKNQIDELSKNLTSDNKSLKDISQRKKDQKQAEFEKILKEQQSYKNELNKLQKQHNLNQEMGMKR